MSPEPSTSPRTIQVLIIDPAAPKVAQRTQTEASWQALSALVGGPLEAIGLGPEADCVLYAHAEGKTDGLPVNLSATALLRHVGTGLAPEDFVVGPVVICGVLSPTGDRDGEDYDATRWVEQQCRSIGLVIGT